jgi:23S rRNA (uridine2552-2'-O)-methyltransferase
VHSTQVIPQAKPIPHGEKTILQQVMVERAPGRSAQREGYRSRACYKLLELQEKDRLIRPGMTVIDLGSAPGGWSQVAVEQVGHNGRVIASDILAMDSLAGVEFTDPGGYRRQPGGPGDFGYGAQYERNERRGPAAVYVPGGVGPGYGPSGAGARGVICGQSIFQGEGFDELIRDARGSFDKVLTRKPKASRPRSREVYLVAKGFRGA